MAGKAPGRYWREGTHLKGVPSRDLPRQRGRRGVVHCGPLGPTGFRCPRCDGDNVYEPGGKAPMRFRCRPCRRFFSTKTGTVMEHSNISYEDWLIAMYYLTVGIKGPVLQEACPRRWNHPEVGVAPGPPDQGGLGGQIARVHGDRGGR